MVFKRRDKQSNAQRLKALVYPRGGWRRAISYICLRLRRLPDRPARIARGISCGVFVCFTPFFGFHFFLAIFFAWMVQGNKIAAFLATLVGNPVTFPLIAASSIHTGELIMQVETPIPLSQILSAFASAFGELARNLVNITISGTAEWDRLHTFFHAVFIPYAVGSLIPGLIAATVAYVLSHKVILAYQKRRETHARKRLARKKPDKADNGGATP
ncbi:DUF2062 domain-containing protein [Meridianimarinicoccus aquatilis]|uniref:DUF2062 domain-containing protein n=1 Tax=Meridianimarinicoccus aquatilis TaxID=2552766 RepID=A0A4R6AUW5_9RHOB|nr:DUF2062 domain-containing protein [Fluviibacterium aquatile]QIE40673.1 DUF2062 domain-containing protein [Rhodobacteraceae bacterium SC52]TDL87877.1 DUF2062 domain-containing protein [Fluviibacterium aquatile]